MADNGGIPEQTMVVILAAGKGTRMGRSDLVKVCFEIDSVPAINRQLAVFKRQRFSRFLLVVGAHADQVLETVSREHSGVLYVHQEPQLGTGHAAKFAAAALQAIGYQGYVLVAMGDKLLEGDALEALVSGYVKQRADLALLTIPKTKFTEASAGRVFVDEEGQALDIIEQADLARQMIADDLREKLAKAEGVTGRDVLAAVANHITRPEKQEVAVPELLALAKSEDKAIERAKLEKVLQATKYNLEIGGKRYPGKQIDRLASGVNPSLYLMRAAVFYAGVGMLRNDNAQGEYYITDMVRLLSGIRDPQGLPRYRVRAVAGRASRVGAGLQFARRAAGHPGLRAAEAAPPAGDAGSRQPAATQARPICHRGQWLAKLEAGPAGAAALAVQNLRPARRPSPAEVPRPRQRAPLLRKAVWHG